MGLRTFAQAATSHRCLTPGSTARCRRLDLHSIPPGPLHPDVRWLFARMSGLTYTAAREPQRQASCVAPRRGQDTALLRCGAARGRLPASPTPAGCDAVDAAFAADALDRTPLPRVADQRRGWHLAHHLPSRSGRHRDCRGFRQEDPEDAGRGRPEQPEKTQGI